MGNESSKWQAGGMQLPFTFTLPLFNFLQYCLLGTVYVEAQRPDEVQRH